MRRALKRALGATQPGFKIYVHAGGAKQLAVVGLSWG